MRLKKFHRRGFTLVELLVVVAIIAALVARTTAAVMRFRGAGVGSATKTNLSKVHAKIRDQWKSVTDKARNDSLGAQVNAAYAASAGTNLADPAVRNRYVQLRQIQAFPTNFNEAFWPDPSWKPKTPTATAPNAWPGYVSHLAKFGIRPDNESAWGTLSPDVQASICLLMIIERGPGGGNAQTTGDDLGANASGSISIGNTTARGIVDGWKRPVLFIRNNNAGQTATIQLVSAGNDGKFNTPDDIVVSNP